MTPPEGENFTKATTYGSTRSSSDSFGNSDYDVEETTPLNPSSSISTKECGPKPNRKVTLTIAVATILVGGFWWSDFHRTGHAYIPSHHNNNNNSNDTNKSPNNHTSPSSSGMINGSLPSPLSQGLALSVTRHDEGAPSDAWGARQSGVSGGVGSGGPLPTNSWYLNLLSHRAAVQPDFSSSVYTVPYKIDTAPPSTILTGVRVHWPVLQSSATNVQMVDDFKNSISLGATTTSTTMGTNQVVDSKYVVHPDLPLSPLAVSLQWPDLDKDASTSTKSTSTSMVTHLVRGMPYVTMEYYGKATPRLYSFNGPASPILLDSTNTSSPEESNTLSCGVVGGKPGHTVRIERELKLHLSNSDFTWMVFFSRPVQATCEMSSMDVDTRDFTLDIVPTDDDSNDTPLIVRLALLDQCTTGSSNIKQHCLTKDFDTIKYEALLRAHAGIFPTNPQIHFAYASSASATTTNNDKEAIKDEQDEIMTIDWGARSFQQDQQDVELIAYALPHHQATLGESTSRTDLCTSTFHGSTCLVKGNTWTIYEDLGQPMSFTAPRPPEPTMIPILAQALSEDLPYILSSNMHRGAADTYFSGKLLARLGRVVVIAKELLALASGEAEYADVEKETLSWAQQAAAAASLPADKEVEAALEELRRGVEIWLTKPEAAYLYDETWGGLINCGCRYTGTGGDGFCNNTFPDCPALADVNQDFGNAFYADHHYHYGYHVYAAAVVAKYDQAWGEKFFDQVLWYIRDFANPFEDKYFTPFRQKDWFLGSSWASGIISAETSPHGRDEESSSEAIAAYEAVTLFGSVMADSFAKSKDPKQKIAETVRDAGQLLVATELHATNRYWHVWNSATHNSTYPEAYKQPVVGMMHGTMASFETWFSPYSVVSYGIQLMPLTPVAEDRDDHDWATLLYPLYKESCEKAGDFCVDNGWSIFQAGLLATTGDRQGALKQALAVPSKVFASQGGVGNSRTNLIWYIATRKDIVPNS